MSIAFVGDIRHTLRLMRRAPGFSALAVLMLAVGTGANIAMFSVVDAVMLRSPFRDPERLAIVRIDGPDGRPTSRMPAERFASLAESPRLLAGVAAIGGGSHVLTGAGDPRRLDLECVTASMFDVLGARPFAGRTFTAADDHADAPPTVILAFDFARQLGDPAALVGSALTLNMVPVTVVGVMPRAFAGPYSRNDTSGWLPLGVTLSGGGLRGCSAASGVNVFARLRDRVTRADTEASLPGIHLTSLSESTIDDVRTPFIVLATAVACVLLIACLNVGGLQMERAVARRREMAVRLALGAGRSRLVAQMLTEHFVLAALGSAAGVAIAIATLRSVVSMLPGNLPHLAEIGMNVRALAAAITVAVIATLASGAVPALQIGRVDPIEHLGGSGRATPHRTQRIRRGVVVLQMALSIAVLIAAALMIQTFMTLRPTHPGFDPARKLSTLVRLPGAPQDASARFFARLFDRVRALDGVRAVTGSSYLPMSGVVSTVSVSLNDHEFTPYAAAIDADYQRVMNILIVAGRSFTARDTARSPSVAIVNESFARLLRPEGTVIGARVRAVGPRMPGSRPLEREIVGVMADTRSSGTDTRVRPEFYVPYSQNATPVLYVIVETDVRHDAAVSAGIREALRALQPDLVVEPIEPLPVILGRRLGTTPLGAWLLGVFAAIAALLTAAGLMTTIGSWVEQRTGEFGVRLALGAAPARIVLMVVAQGATLTACGIVTGCVLAAGTTRFLEGWIYGVTPLDRFTFVMSAASMLVIAAAALYAPVLKSVRIDPAASLRAL